MVGMSQPEMDAYISTLDASDQARFHASRSWERGVLSVRGKLVVPCGAFGVRIVFVRCHGCA